jgi:hypothetical protein
VSDCLFSEVFRNVYLCLKIKEAEQSNTRLHGLSLAGVAGLIPVGIMEVFLLGLLCIVTLYDGPIPHPQEFYRQWCVIVCDLETSRIRRTWLALGCCT